MKTIPAKTLISKTKYAEYWFGNEYNMNIYRGCNQGCIYCDSRSLCYNNPEFDTVHIKENALALIERELAAKRNKGVVGTGAMSDPYNSFEQVEKATRGALSLFDRYGFGTGICTKNTMVVRDIDLLRRISKHSPATVCMTITSSDDSLAKKIEPGAPDSSNRFRALLELSRYKIYCGVLMMPLLTDITDTEENIRGLVKMAHEAGVDFIYPSFGFTMRDGNREYLYDKLDESFPGLRQKYTRIYGNSYECNSPAAQKLSELFTELCKGYKIKYRMKDIIQGAAERVGNKQVTMF